MSQNQETMKRLLSKNATRNICASKFTTPKIQHFEVPITKFGRNEEFSKSKSSFKEEMIILESKIQTIKMLSRD
jgi:hypothetical protein